MSLVFSREHINKRRRSTVLMSLVFSREHINKRRRSTVLMSLVFSKVVVSTTPPLINVFSSDVFGLQ
jgi:hypothetical protein